MQFYQYVYGDSRSGYCILYAQDASHGADAAKVQRLVRLPDVSEAERSVMGYFPFDERSDKGCSLFFCIKKDTTLTKRGISYQHGVFTDADVNFFAGDDYLQGMLADFLDQSHLDAVRDGDDSAVGDVVPVGSLMDALPDTVEIPGGSMVRILRQLYREENTLIVIDDDRYSDDFARILVRKIFSYLPAALRKNCSYLIGAYETGNMSFRLRIIPESLLANSRHISGIRLFDTESPDIPEDVWVELAEKILRLAESSRKKMLSAFNVLSYGEKNGYSHFDQGLFLDVCRNYLAALDDQTDPQAWDRIIEQFLQDEHCDVSTKIPPHPKKVLNGWYAKTNWAEHTFAANELSVADLNEYAEAHLVDLYKLYYVVDTNMTFLHDFVTTELTKPHAYDWVVRQYKSLNDFTEGRLNHDNKSEPVRLFYQFAQEGVSYIESLFNSFRRLEKDVSDRAWEIMRSSSGEPDGELKKKLHNMVRFDFLPSLTGKILDEKQVLIDLVDNEFDTYTQMYYDRKQDNAKHQTIGEVIEKTRAFLNQYSLAFLSKYLDIPTLRDAGLSREDLALITDGMETNEEENRQTVNMLAEFIKIAASRSPEDFFGTSHEILDSIRYDFIAPLLFDALVQSEKYNLAILFLLKYGEEWNSILDILDQDSAANRWDAKDFGRSKPLIHQILRARFKRGKDVGKVLERIKKTLSGDSKEKKDSYPVGQKKVLYGMIKQEAQRCQMKKWADQKKFVLIPAAVLVIILIVGITVLITALANRSGQDATEADTIETVEESQGPNSEGGAEGSTDYVPANEGVSPGN